MADYSAVINDQNMLKHLNVSLQDNYSVAVHECCRYLIDVRWLKLWKKYVGYDEWESGMIGEETANPGPIDNSNLLEGVNACFFTCY